MIAPKSESADLVMKWLGSENLSNSAVLSPRLDSVIVEASVTQIEKLLGAEYDAFGKTISCPQPETHLFSALLTLSQFNPKPANVYSGLLNTASQNNLVATLM